jgi:hypothetical protein
MITSFRFVRVSNRKLSSFSIISVSPSYCKLAIEYQYVLLAVHNFLHISPAQRRTF